MVQALRFVPCALAIFNLERSLALAGTFYAQAKAAVKSFLRAGVCIHFSLSGMTVAVTTPLTYTALNTSATTALAGVGATYKVVPTVTTLASAGVETDISTNNGTYTATGITGLTPINFNPSPVRTRPTAMLGAYYDIEKNQRLGLNAIYRQEAYQGVSSTTVMATYTVGL